MSCTNLKHYHEEDHNAKDFVETHFSHGDVSIIEESTVEPAKRLHELFSSGLVKGDKLLHISVGAMVYPLLSASNVFKNIYVMDATDTSVNHFKQWLKKGDGATDWSFASKLVSQLEGNVDGWKEKEEQVRRAVKDVFKYNLFNDSSTGSVAIPQVDCVLTVFIFNVICKTKEDFKKSLKTFTSWLKVGGYLVFFITLNMTFYRVGNQKYSTLTVHEKFVREAVTNAGFAIEKDEVLPTSVENDIVDYENMLFLVARKLDTAREKGRFPDTELRNGDWCGYTI
ncbi:nicotinamide N-methyltransferase-like [Hyla sarda]|uniref:nicotinamide N-methyltransferase-like n=1 Tax=Hyla sarda TaxID=327740 RepID=UPI0024C3DBA3|nr:nicotinamide N-methyltransferase-like [Hyla sarda]